MVLEHLIRDAAATPEGALVLLHGRGARRPASAPAAPGLPASWR